MVTRFGNHVVHGQLLADKGDGETIFPDKKVINTFAIYFSARFKIC